MLNTLSTNYKYLYQLFDYIVSNKTAKKVLPWPVFTTKIRALTLHNFLVFEGSQFLCVVSIHCSTCGTVDK